MATIKMTNSAMARAKQMNIGEKEISGVIDYPEKTYPGREPGTSQFIGKSGNVQLTVIAKRNGSEWLVLSCWTKHTSNFDVKYDPRKKNASFWKKIWLDLISTFGL